MRRGHRSPRGNGVLSAGDAGTDHPAGSGDIGFEESPGGPAAGKGGQRVVLIVRAHGEHIFRVGGRIVRRAAGRAFVAGRGDHHDPRRAQIMESPA